MIPQVVASERGTAQTRELRLSGVVGLKHLYLSRIGTLLENMTEEGESPVQVQLNMISVS